MVFVRRCLGFARSSLEQLRAGWSSQLVVVAVVEAAEW
jgi:hypothetical protein